MAKEGRALITNQLIVLKATRDRTNCLYLNHDLKRFNRRTQFHNLATFSSPPVKVPNLAGTVRLQLMLKYRENQSLPPLDRGAAIVRGQRRRSAVC